MEDIVKYVVYGAVLLTALMLGKWYATERDKIMRRGEPWVNSLATKPGVLIIVILAALIIFNKIYN